ncbi:hypothetical protein [Streptomyces sp. NPDC058398]|uniref:hypothetical protein n=1 Tax=Streptomyces sp. NPDC058398 TaxID=3346479 RepID=UPI0036637BFE
MSHGRLAALSLSAQAEQVYLHCLRHPGAPPEDVGAVLGLDCHATGAALDELFRCGLLRLAQGRRVLPEDPAVALEGLVERRLRELDRAVREVTATRTAVASLAGEFRTASTALARRGTLRDAAPGNDLDGPPRVDELVFLTYEEALFLRPSLTPGSVAAVLPLDRRALSRGVALRKIVQGAALGTMEAREYVAELVERGAHVRVTDVPGDSVLVLDRSVVVRPADVTAAGRSPRVVRHPWEAARLVSDFDAVWAGARELPAGQR